MQKMLAAVILLLILSVSFIICQVSPASADINENIKASALVSHFSANITYANATASYLSAEVAVNFRRIPNQTIPVDGVTDFYKVELISNGKVIGSNIRGCSIGQGLSMEQMAGLSMSYGHIGFNVVGGNQKIMKWDVWYNSASPIFVEPLSIRLSRIGWVIVNSSQLFTYLSINQEVQEVQLLNSGNSYTYGNPNINDIPNLVTPAPSDTSVSTPESVYTAPTAIFVVVILAVVAAIGVFLLCWRRKVSD